MSDLIKAILKRAAENDYVLYSEDYLFEFDNKVYEDLRHYEADEDSDSEFRVVFDYDDYDYVEDKELIEQLKSFRA